METYRIAEENKKYYEDFLPTDLRSMLYQEEMQSFCVVDDQKDETIPVGLMIVSVPSPDCYTIEWLFISHEYIGQGCGDLLLSLLIEMGKRDGVETIRYKKRYFEGDEAEKTEADDFIDYWYFERGFLTDYSNVVDMVFYYGSMDKNIVFKKPLSYDEVKSFSELTDEQLAEQYGRLYHKYGYTYEKSLDEDVSVAYISEGKIRAVLAVRRYENTYVPIDIYSFDSMWDKKIIIKLMLTFLRLSYDKSKDEGVLHINCMSQEPLAFIGGMFNEGSALLTKMLAAPIDADVYLAEKAKRELEESIDSYKRIENIPDELEVVEVEYYSGVKTNI